MKLSADDEACDYICNSDFASGSLFVVLVHFLGPTSCVSTGTTETNLCCTGVHFAVRHIIVHFLLTAANFVDSFNNIK